MNCLVVSKLSNLSPPINPPKTKLPKFGKYCIKAEAKIYNSKTNEQVGFVVGFDTVYDIVSTVSETCDINTRRRNLKCGETQVTILPHSSTFNCSGIFFKFNKQ